MSCSTVGYQVGKVHGHKSIACARTVVPVVAHAAIGKRRGSLAWCCIALHLQCICTLS